MAPKPIPAPPKPSSPPVQKVPSNWKDQRAADQAWFDAFIKGEIVAMMMHSSRSMPSGTLWGDSEGVSMVKGETGTLRELEGACLGSFVAGSLVLLASGRSTR